MSRETVKIDPAVLAAQVEEGMKKDALAAHYGLNISQMGAALKQAGLKIRKFHTPAFEFVTGGTEVVTKEAEEVTTTVAEEDLVAPEAETASETTSNVFEASEEESTTGTPVWKD